MPDDVYTLGMWRVETESRTSSSPRGRPSARYLNSLPHPPGPGTLVQNVDEPQQFYFFGPLDSLDAIEEMRAKPETRSEIGKLMDLCDDGRRGTFRVVATPLRSSNARHICSERVTFLSRRSRWWSTRGPGKYALVVTENDEPPKTCRRCRGTVVSIPRTTSSRSEPSCTQQATAENMVRRMMDEDLVRELAKLSCRERAGCARCKGSTPSGRQLTRIHGSRPCSRTLVGRPRSIGHRRGTKSSICTGHCSPAGLMCSRRGGKTLGAPNQGWSHCFPAPLQPLGVRLRRRIVGSRRPRVHRRRHDRGRADRAWNGRARVTMHTSGSSSPRVSPRPRLGRLRRVRF